MKCIYTMLKTKLIVGLWNPWKEYLKTRHNIGFNIIDWIVDYSEWTKFMFNKKFNSDISIFRDWKYVIIFAKPQTYMNLSWEAVSKILSYYKIDFKNLLVIHDELDLQEWRIKLKRNWWNNWHNWLKSIDLKIWTNKYWKLKCGIWRPDEKWQVVDYVLWKLPNDVLQKFESQKDYIFGLVRQFLVAN